MQTARPLIPILSRNGTFVNNSWYQLNIPLLQTTRQWNNDGKWNSNPKWRQVQRFAQSGSWSNAAISSRASNERIIHHVRNSCYLSERISEKMNADSTELWIWNLENVCVHRIRSESLIFQSIVRPVKWSARHAHDNGIYSYIRRKCEWPISAEPIFNQYGKIHEPDISYILISDHPMDGRMDRI